MPEPSVDLPGVGDSCEEVEECRNHDGNGVGSLCGEIWGYMG